MKHRLASLLRDQSGMALVEFAMILPVLILLYAGSYQLTDAFSVYRKATATARTLADLTTQSTTLTNNDLADIFTAARQVLSPYSSTPASMTITHITTNAAGVSKVDWSRTPTGNGYATGAVITLPGAITYQYTALILPSLLGSIPLSDKIYMNPRRSEKVTLK